DYLNHRLHGSSAEHDHQDTADDQAPTASTIRSCCEVPPLEGERKDCSDRCNPWRAGTRGEECHQEIPGITRLLSGISREFQVILRCQHMFVHRGVCWHALTRPSKQVLGRAYPLAFPRACVLGVVRLFESTSQCLQQG